ncbi:peptidase S66 [Pontibacillus chungwhensis BH030062]|uniref:Peptidase S66 n=1 Tax=Pontibacillus chungwhensis BH030062 TaxID=1385513 RepID=A0A0A2UVT3_9BACI|nr:S66 peptidase family protein [Pontibacillus chungwhensis]KGP90626.1 peptidase S66 [Pontibacillus chungwhensis BH030062]
MILYPRLTEDTYTIGVTAPSSGVPEELHPLLQQAEEKMKRNGKTMVFGQTAWKQDKARSASALERAQEFNDMMRDDSVDLIIPPWGGELLIETLEHIHFDDLPSKWVLGYSDTSLLLLTTTLQTGIATAHGTNLVDLRGEESDLTTSRWIDVLTTEKGGAVTQYSSDYYQKEWDFENPTPHIFHLTESTEWKTVTGAPVQVEGRLLGGCIDVVRHLVGTPFDRVDNFQQEYIGSEPVLWYFENCQLSTTDLRRTLTQMKLAGWFNHISGILFGRSPANHPVGNYEVLDVYQELADELDVPIIYDIDCGHVPPQLTIVNGAYAKVSVQNGAGTFVQKFKP